MLLSGRGVPPLLITNEDIALAVVDSGAVDAPCAGRALRVVLTVWRLAGFAKIYSLIKSYALHAVRGSANRRVAYVSRNNGKAVESLLKLPSMKSCQPIGGSSKILQL